MCDAGIVDSSQLERRHTPSPAAFTAIGMRNRHRPRDGSSPQRALRFPPPRLVRHLPSVRCGPWHCGLRGQVTNTYWCLQAVPELMAVAAQRFESCMPELSHA